MLAWLMNLDFAGGGIFPPWSRAMQIRGTFGVDEVQGTFGDADEPKGTFGVSEGLLGSA